MSKSKLSIEEWFAKQADAEGEDLGTEEMEGGKIYNILRAWRAGYSRKDIIAFGFNKTTVYRQVGEFEKLRKAPAMSMFGFELYEARILRLMNRKKNPLTRDEAITKIAEMDTDPEPAEGE
jgi:hypothetical protein